MKKALLLNTILAFQPTFSHDSKVEELFLQKGNRLSQYPHERIPSIEVSNCIELGKLTALRFLEWVQQNPDGVIALPTGKSPEHFINFLQHYKAHWHDASVQQELQTYGLHGPSFPDTSNLKFVQLDEFFPIEPFHENSFYHYVNKYYVPLLDLKQENCLLIDPAHIMNVERFCSSYEQTINEWGGIGFFLGGIGPDGHVAFNVFGSAPNSLTRLVMLNYESACAIAPSLGGMQYARNKTAITIGLDTIMRKKDATIIIIAAGEGKAPMVAHAIEQDDDMYPASVLQKHTGTRFYITHGAASQLQDRYLATIHTQADLFNDTKAMDRIFVTASLQCKKPIASLTLNDLKTTADGAIVAERTTNIAPLAQACHERFVSKISTALPQNKSIMHTAPHHDDVMLSYHPIAVQTIAHNHNHIAYLTSGFNAVTNSYIQEILTGMDHSFITHHAPTIFSDTYQSLLSLFAEAYRANNTANMFLIEQLIVAQLMASIYRCASIDDLVNRINWIQESYVATIRPGEKDNPSMQLLKGSIRETEVDRMWHIHGLSTNHISHLRSQFYTGDYFTPKPTFNYDVKPMLSLLEKYKPAIVTLAFDPEGTGPDTHYKVLQVVAEAVRAWDQQPEIWGYRNVWYRFEPYDSTMMVPVSEEQLATQHSIFMHCFSTQKDAPFPSHFHDGPFSELSVMIQKEQLAIMRTLLGNDYFDTHENESIRNAAGICFIKKMDTDAFLAQAEQLRSSVEEMK